MAKCVPHSFRSGNNLPEKANKILNGVLIVLILIAVKSWHLAVVQHEKKEQEAKKPQRRVVIERSERATIVDRSGVPLAINKVQYNAAVCYAPIRSMPRTAWKKEGKKRLKCFPRKEYIAQLSQKLAEELHLDAGWIEDMIHARAAILGNVPCMICQNISERQYFRLKMLEKDWPGIAAEIAARRCYPQEGIGQEIVGYIGPISRQEYESITQEMQRLRAILSAYEEGEKPQEIIGYTSIEQVSKRLEDLEKRAYRICDLVGKVGVEATYDEELKGLCGKQVFLADIKGNVRHKLSGSEDAVCGTQLKLSLSSELQKYALKLLAEYENEPAKAVAAAKRHLIPEYQPWIKGGAIVVMDPLSGEVVAMASSPSFNPNDFIRTGSEGDIEKNKSVHRWLETEQHIAQIWDMATPLRRPRYHEGHYEEELILSWDNYLDFILPRDSRIMEVIKKHATLKDALFVQKKVQELIELFYNAEVDLSPEKVIYLYFAENQTVPQNMLITLQEKAVFKQRMEEVERAAAELRRELEPYFSPLGSGYDKLLLTDLYRLAADSSLFTDELAAAVGSMNISSYRSCQADFVAVKQAVCSIVKEYFCEHDFKEWQAVHFQDYLAEKREEETRLQKKYPRPYIEYLEEAKKKLFRSFWQERGWDLILLFILDDGSIAQTDPYSAWLLNWKREIEAGAYRGLSWVSNYKALKALVRGMEAKTIAPFLKTLRSFEQLERPLLGRYSGLQGKMERHLAAAFYPSYGFGFARSTAFRQATTIGSIFKLVPSYEALRQKYLAAIEDGSCGIDLNPLTIIDDKHLVNGKKQVWNVGFTLDGKAIPMFYRGGRLPRTDHYKVGKVDLVRALEVSSNPYFALIAGDVLEDPEDLCHAANLLGFGEKTGVDLPYEYGGFLPKDITYDRSGLYAMSIGQHSLLGTPLQVAGMLSCIANGGKMLKPKIVSGPPEVRWEVFMPKPIQHKLLQAMQQVVMGEKGTARSLRKQFEPNLVKQIIGKTSTSEVVERVSLDGENGQMKLKHVWFGAISYEGEDFSRPELVVVAYLRYGGWGHDAAPLAVKMVKKWREIKQRM